MYCKDKACENFAVSYMALTAPQKNVIFLFFATFHAYIKELIIT